MSTLVWLGIEACGMILCMVLSAIPERGVLLHIGLPKTGTTSLQRTLFRAVDELSAANVLLRSPETWQRGTLTDGRPSAEQAWGRLEADLVSHNGRVVINNELICDATADQARRTVKRLGRPVCVMVTVRSLPDLLPSVWQQMVKGALDLPTRYEDWLRETIADHERNQAFFWKRNDLPRLLENWGAAVGEENVVLVVVDKKSPDTTTRVTEELLALPASTLSDDGKTGVKNVSLSYATAEMLRQIRLKATMINPRQRRQFIKLFKREIERSGARGEPIPVPEWAVEGLRPVGLAFARELEGSSATIVGDPQLLAVPTKPPTPRLEEPDRVPMAAAVAATVGALRYAQSVKDVTPQAEVESEPPNRPWSRISPKLRRLRR